MKKLIVLFSTMFIFVGVVTAQLPPPPPGVDVTQYALHPKAPNYLVDSDGVGTLDYNNPGHLYICDAVTNNIDLLIEPEHIDKEGELELFRPERDFNDGGQDDVYYVDFVYIKPNSTYPYGVIKVPGGCDIRVCLDANGNLVLEAKVSSFIPPFWQWSPIYTSTCFYSVNPDDHGQPKNPWWLLEHADDPGGID